VVLSKSSSVSSCEFFVVRKSSNLVLLVILLNVEVLKLFGNFIELVLTDLDQGVVEKSIRVSSDLRELLNFVTSKVLDFLSKFSFSDELG